MSDLKRRVDQRDADLERALASVLKFNPRDLAANRNGRATARQRLRMGISGFVVLLIAAAFAFLPGLGFAGVRSSGVDVLKVALLTVLVELPLLVFVGSRGVNMLLDAFSDSVTTDSGRLQFGTDGMPPCGANFVYDHRRPSDLSMSALLVSGMDVSWTKWTRQPADGLIRFSCDDLGRHPKTRKCVAYHSRWSRRPLAMELDRSERITSA